MSSFVAQSVSDFEPYREEPVLDSIFSQFEKVVVQSLITSFGLDFLVKDQHGGDVDTVHNVRQIGTDKNMYYKNRANEEAYQNRGEYDSAEYHSDSRYIEKNRQISAQRKEGALVDSYTGETIPRNGKSDLDHVVSAKEIHDDRGRVLAGLKGTDLANRDENLQATNPHTNRTKKADSMDTFLEKHGSEYTEEQKARMRQQDKIARTSQDQLIERAYYSSPQFRNDTLLAAGNVSLRMGARQAVGLIFTEIWFAVKDEFKQLQAKGSYDFADSLKAVGGGVQKGWLSAKEKYKELFSKFLEGSIAGFLSSLVTTLCNIFFSTAKNAVKIIRQTWASLVEAFKILFINPDGLLLGDRIRAATKILATGASVVAGVLVSELVGKTGVGAIPVVGDVIQVFCGTFVSGMLSCLFLYFIDRSPLFNKLVDFLNNLPTMGRVIASFREEAAKFEAYAAKLMEIDLDRFKSEVAFYSSFASQLENAKNETELGKILDTMIQKLGISLPWGNHRSFDDFMRDKNARLVFK